MKSPPDSGRLAASIAAIVLLGFTAIAVSTGISNAKSGNAGLQALSLENPPLPTPRPVRQALSVVTAAAPAAAVRSSATLPVHAGKPMRVSPAAGNLRAGLDAISAKNAAKALAIRAGMRPGSLDRKILAWAIAISGVAGVPSADIAAIAADLPDWPAPDVLRRNGERAIARENHSPETVIRAFGSREPETFPGGLALAKAYLAKKDTQRARAAFARHWQRERLTAKSEKSVLRQVGAALTTDDHRRRMHQQFYKERSRSGLRMGALAEQYSLSLARAAVIDNAKNADALLKGVKPPSNRDAGYLYSRIKRLRRTGEYKRAAQLMLRAPSDPDQLIDPDEWWIERRLISRALLEEGDAKTAYKIAAGHAAQDKVKRAEAEFHAGWYALRFLNDPATAYRHFAMIDRISQTPISQARAHYWMGRSLKGKAATEQFREAARHAGTFYGQLAAQKLGIRKLRVNNSRPTPAERARFASRDLVRAIERLEAVDYGWRAETIYRHLAGELTSAGEIAILAARAEKQGKHNLALQIGKMAYWRGLPVETVAWPIGAIPAGAKTPGAGKALAYAVARQESAFNAGAISPARARGLLQLLPGTAKMMARKLGVSYSTRKLTSDPAYNTQLGSAYLSEQLDNFSNSYILTFAGYNAGPGRVREWIRRFGDPRNLAVEDVIDWIERIPFTETRNYVQRVMENYQVYKARLASASLDIEADLRHGRN